MALRGDIRLWHGNTGNIALFYFVMVAALTLHAGYVEASQDVLPSLCDNVHCPPLDEITCPEDSDVRYSIKPIDAAALMQTITAAPTANVAFTGYNTSDIPEELFAQCCVAKKCICRTCYIPDCPDSKHDVIFELTPENMNTPGQCCGTYKCLAEPNCTEVRDTESYWLTNCQRCKCFSGERICHQSCDEGTINKPTAMCNPKSLNRFFQHGESWKDGCYECECVNGEEKCMLPFCRSVNCPTHRQVILRDSCCPICWPAHIPMPNADDAEYDEKEMLPPLKSYDEEDDTDENAGRSHDYEDNEIDTLPNLLLNSAELNSTAVGTNTTSASITKVIQTSTTAKPEVKVVEYTASTSTESTTSTSTESTTVSPTTTSTTSAAPLPVTIFTAKTATPCPRHDAAPATYQVYPDIVEVVHQSNDCLYYTIIGFLIFVVLVLVAWNIHLRAKQRSYRPVSNFDDNFNKMSSNIKKTNDYV